MKHTLAEKIIMDHLDGQEVSPGDLVTLEPDFVCVHDIYTESLYKKFKEMGLKKVWNKDKIAVIHDHLNPAALPSDPESLTYGYKLVEELDLIHFHPTGGIVHQLIPELGYAKPGDIVFVTDSHTTTYGALAALSTGVGHTEMAAIWGTGQMWIRVPSTIRIEIEGTLPDYVTGKDIILRVLGDLGAAGASYKSLEFAGSAIRTLPMDDRLTISNMGVECGAKATLFEADEITAEYTGLPLEEISWLRADEGASYERVLTYKAEDLEPVLSCPPYVDKVQPLREVQGVKLDQVFLGSCTNGRLSDLREVAKVLEGRTIAPGLKFIVTPASDQVYKEAMEAGYIQTLLEAGALMTPAYCSFCEGRTMGLLSEDQVALGTNNRNFLGRYGSSKAQVYLSSPAVAAASAVAGQISHPQDLD